MALPRLERLAALGAGAALAAVAGGCSFDGSGQAGLGGDAGGGSLSDADDGIGGRVDAAPIDAPELCTGWEVLAVVDSCEIPSAFRRDELVVPAGVYTYNTDDGVLLRQGGGEVEHDSVLIGDFRIVSAASIAIEEGAELRAVGDRPLALVSWSDMTMAGSIDVSSHLAGEGRGAGSDPVTPCSAGGVAAGPGLEDENGGGGGGGGAFGSNGGPGGDGATDTAGASGDRSPGPTRLRGGCPGGPGGVGANGVAAAGGGGGGAIALVALGALSVTGQIDAGGAGGGGGGIETLGGGGGGGSGGLIWLDGASITLSSSTILAANGGGGGEGSDADAAGTVGDDAPRGGTRASGGETAGNSGGDGGDGEVGGVDGAAGGAGVSNSGGGGGGGGAGVIDLDSDEVDEGGAFITPPPR